MWTELPRLVSAGADEAAVKLAGEIRSSGVAVALVVHEHKRLGRGIELAMLAEELKGSHDPSGVVFTVLAAMSGMERECIRDRTLEGHGPASRRGKTIGGEHVIPRCFAAGV